MLVTHYLKLARESACSVAAVATAAFATGAALTFTLRNTHNDGAQAHAESEATFTEQSQMLTTALATGNWSYVTAALAIADEMVEHCIRGQQTETQTATQYNAAGIALSVLAAASLVAAYAGYKYAAPKPHYQQIQNGPE